MDKRDTNIDIIKGIGITLMVLGHSQFPLTHFIYLFHMPIFFIASGYLFNLNNKHDSYSLTSFVAKKFKSLWQPFFLWNTIFIILNNLFVSLHVYASDMYNYTQYQDTIYAQSHYFSLKETILEITKSFFLVGGTSMTGALWFLRELLMVVVLFAIIHYFLRKCQMKTTLIVHGIISIVLLCFGYAIQCINMPNTTSIGTMCSVYILFYIGILFRQLNLHEKLGKHKVIISITAITVLICLNPFANVDLAGNSYSNPLFLVITSLSGWVFLWNLAYIIEKSALLTNSLCYLGKNTMPIIILNFICFKPITYLIIKIEQLPIQYLAAYPVLKSDNFWWLLYTITSILLALILSTIYTMIVKIERSPKFAIRLFNRKI